MQSRWARNLPIVVAVLIIGLSAAPLLLPPVSPANLPGTTSLAPLAVGTGTRTALPAAADPGDAVIDGYEANRGQAIDWVRFVARSETLRVFLGSHEVQFDFVEPGRSVARVFTQMVFEGASRDPSLAAVDVIGVRIATVTREGQERRLEIPRYGSVWYEDIYPGVDLVWGTDAGWPTLRLLSG